MTKPDKGGRMIEAIIFKADDEERMVYGWASVITEDGEPVIDSEGDVIEASELVKATTAFMLDVRKAMIGHERNAAGDIEDSMVKGIVVHSFPLTAEIAKSLGIETKREGWIVGVKVTDEAVWKGVKEGRFRAFSIGGKGIREEIGVAA